MASPKFTKKGWGGYTIPHHYFRQTSSHLQVSPLTCEIIQCIQKEIKIYCYQHTEVKQQVVSHINADSIKMASVNLVHMYISILSDSALHCRETLFRNQPNIKIEVQEIIKLLRI